MLLARWWLRSILRRWSTGVKSELSRKQRELIELGSMVQSIKEVDHHLDVGAVLSSRRKRWAINDLEASANETLPISPEIARVEIALPQQNRPPRRADCGSGHAVCAHVLQRPQAASGSSGLPQLQL
jgi:hypothetical protein